MIPCNIFSNLCKYYFYFYFSGALSTRSSDVSSILKAKQIGPRSLPVVGPEKQIVEKDIKSSPDLISWFELANQQNREKYTFKNIIEEKNQTGAYSQWRSNSVKAVCSCGFSSTCDCNKNPAVLKVVSTTFLGKSPINIRLSIKASMFEPSH